METALQRVLYSLTMCGLCWATATPMHAQASAPSPARFTSSSSSHVTPAISETSRVQTVESRTSATVELREGRFELDPLTDTLMILGTAAMGVGLQLALPSFGIHDRAPPNDTEDILRIDRWRAETQRTLRFPLGDVTVIAAIGLVLADTIVAGVLDRGDSWLEHVGIYAEVAAVMLSVTSIAKLAFRRPRPTAYWGEENLAPDDYLSFYSGHTALAASLSAAAIYLAFTREASGAERAIITLLGITLTALTGVGRVLTGHHYPTDVLVGTAAGTAVGILVPHLHRRTSGRVQISGTSVTVNF